jgi:RNA polymerase sigma-70 factor (ECF subfamily)
MTEVDDVILVRRAKAGDEAAFAELIDRHQSRVYHHALRLMGNTQDAEEVLQDTFLQVYRNLARFEERSRFSTWIYRIATNEALMRLRKASRKREVFLEDVAGPDEWWGDEIQQVLTELPEDYRVVFTMRDIDGLSNAEVAEVLGLSVPAVKSRLHRSRLHLRDRLSRVFRDRKASGAGKKTS